MDLLLLVILTHYMLSRMRAYLDAQEFQAEDTHLMCALDLQLWIQPVIQCRLLQDDPNLILTIRRQTLEHEQICSEGPSKNQMEQNEALGASAPSSEIGGLTWSAYLSFRQEMT